MVNRSAIKLQNIPKTVRLVFGTSIIFLLIMSGLRLGLFLFFNRQGHSLGGVWSSFVLGVRFDLRYVCILAGLLCLAGRRWVLPVTGVAVVVLAFFYCIDLIYYGYLSQRLSASVLSFFPDAGISVRVVWQTYPIVWIFLFSLVGIWLIRWLIRLVYDRVIRSEEGAVKRHFVWLGAVLILSGVGVFGRLGQYPLRWSDAYVLGDDYVANLALNPFQSFFSSLKYRNSGYDPKKVTAAVSVLTPWYGLDSMRLDRRCPVRSGALTSRPNVVVVICESFSAYKSSMWGNPLRTTPFFNSLCEKGIFFDHCFTPSYGTARGIWAIITGIPDVSEASTTASRNPEMVDQHTIISDFTGYRKLYLLGGSASWANIRGLLTDNIDSLHLYEEENYTAPRVDVWGISDKNLFLEANQLFKQEKHPFFAIVQTADNHRPYTIPAADKGLFSAVQYPLDTLRKYGFESNAEVNAFRYTDVCFQTFITAASREAYFHNTIFLFVGDHGISGDATALFPRAWTDQQLTSEHVPLLIYAPGLIGAKRMTRVCSQLDVLPTLAGLCGVPYRNMALGRDLLDTSRYKDDGLAFIYDPNQASIGVIQDSLFYRRGLRTGKEELVSIKDNNVLPLVGTGKLRGLSEGIYETARYLLLENKKRGSKSFLR